MANTFQYNPLTNGHSIRVFKFSSSASSASDDIHIELLETGLHDVELEFEALSYTWLDPREKAEIYIDDCVLTVTRNLSKFLQHLREENPNGTYWADQICINQQDIPERNKQVAIMADIYKSSRKTRVWLGETVEGIGEALGLLRSIDNLGYTRGTPLSVALPRLVEIIEEYLQRSTARQIGTPEVDEPNLVCTLLINIAKTNRVFLADQFTWFTRAWVIQEVALANECTVQISSHTYQWETLDLACLGLARVDKLTHGTLSLSAALKTRGAATIRHIQFCRSEWISEHARAQHDDFLQVLRRLAPITECSDPRDRIFAFLSLQPRASTALVLQPDYGLSTETVYAQATAAIVAASQNLDIFSYTRFPHLGPEAANCSTPSWAIDWRLPSTMSGLPVPPNASFCACGDLTYKEAAPDASSRVMMVRGKVVDTIDGVASHQNLPDTQGPFAQLEELSHAAVLRRVSHLSDITELQSQQELYDRAIKAVLCYDRSADGPEAAWQHNIKSLLQIYERFRDSYGKPEAQPTSNETDLLGRLAARLDHKSVRILYKTMQRGLVGLAPPLSKVGDAVCILHGSKTPVVLRSSGNLGRYHVLGQAYLEDWMYGDHIDWHEDEADIIQLE
ncbi:heterokaryon incompatibility protein-domain-containing protein [Xylariales sp. PMI_506]|nr:heterokaryon incompatibility protein-domain-containing protein [Xylariales sp. PMI_506]